MAVAESKRRANDKWDRKNMTVLTCKIKKTDADAFRSYCKSREMSANAVLKEFVESKINCGRTSD